MDTLLEPQSKKMGWGGKILVTVVALVFLFVFYISLDANKYRATVRVIEGEGAVGVNPTTELLDFGDLSLGTMAARRVTINNDTPLKMFVSAVKTGDIAGIMDMDRNNFTLMPREKETLEFTVSMPASAGVGDTLDGRVYLFKIPRL